MRLLRLKIAERLRQQNAAKDMQNQEFARAGRALAAAVERNPNDANAHYNLGKVLWAQGGARNAERVVEEFGAAIQLQPTMAAAWRDVGLVFYELRDINRATKAFEQYLQLAPDAPDAMDAWLALAQSIAYIYGRAPVAQLDRAPAF